ncbi:MAG: lysozyme, partial [Lachnospiraceae bacterium]|nr:lysozyme [Lachnospiraceae bacterium]
INADPGFEEHIAGAQAAGLDVGVYFFSQAVNEEEAVEEAEFVVEQLKNHELQLPVVYDPETILDKAARTDNVTGEQFTANTIAFCEKISECGYEPMIYCNMKWEAFELDLSRMTDIPIWYADYETYPQTPYQFEIWQYTEKGLIEGINGSVDLNIQICTK